MLLLNASPIAYDASRAVGRVKQLEVKTMRPQSISELLNLPNMQVTAFAFEEQNGSEYVHLFCEHEAGVAICPCCQQVVTGIYDSKERSVRHLDIFGKRCIIHFEQRRFDCSKCNKPFSEPLAWIDPKRRQTRAFEQYIYECITNKKMTRKGVARAEGLERFASPWGT